jgi:hypothetical protein
VRLIAKPILSMTCRNLLTFNNSFKGYNVSRIRAACYPESISERSADLYFHLLAQLGMPWLFAIGMVNKLK